MDYIARLDFMLLFCVHSSKFGKCLLIRQPRYNIQDTIEQVLYVQRFQHIGWPYAFRTIPLYESNHSILLLLFNLRVASKVAMILVFQGLISWIRTLVFHFLLEGIFRIMLSFREIRLTFSHLSVRNEALSVLKAPRHIIILCKSDCRSIYILSHRCNNLICVKQKAKSRVANLRTTTN